MLAFGFSDSLHNGGDVVLREFGRIIFDSENVGIAVEFDFFYSRLLSQSSSNIIRSTESHYMIHIGQAVDIEMYGFGVH